MFCFVKDKFLYIPIPKNGYMTFSMLLEKNDWQKLNLFENDLDLSTFTIWSHITNPNIRHTKGVEQYLRLNPDININDPSIAKMLVSGVFDEHTYSLNMMLGKILNYPIQWIPLDVVINGMDGDELTNLFFKEHRIDLIVTKNDRLNKSIPRFKQVQKQIDQTKELYNENYQKLSKNFLEIDILLYNKVVQEYREKYE